MFSSSDDKAFSKFYTSFVSAKDLCILLHSRQKQSIRVVAFKTTEYKISLQCPGVDVTARGLFTNFARSMQFLGKKIYSLFSNRPRYLVTCQRTIVDLTYVIDEPNQIIELMGRPLVQYLGVDRC